MRQIIFKILFVLMYSIFVASVIVEEWEMAIKALFLGALMFWLGFKFKKPEMKYFNTMDPVSGVARPKTREVNSGATIEVKTTDNGERTYENSL